MSETATMTNPVRGGHYRFIYKSKVSKPDESFIGVFYTTDEDSVQISFVSMLQHVLGERYWYFPWKLEPT
jgi:hypothetical protein